MQAIGVSELGWGMVTRRAEERSPHRRYSCRAVVRKMKILDKNCVSWFFSSSWKVTMMVPATNSYELKFLE